MGQTSRHGITVLVLFLSAAAGFADDSFHRGFVAGGDDTVSEARDDGPGRRNGGVLSLPGRGSRGMVSSGKPTTARPSPVVTRGVRSSRSTQKGPYNPPTVATRGFGKPRGRGFTDPSGEPDATAAPTKKPVTRLTPIQRIATERYDRENDAAGAAYNSGNVTTYQAAAARVTTVTTMNTNLTSSFDAFRSSNYSSASGRQSTYTALDGMLSNLSGTAEQRRTQALEIINSTTPEGGTPSVRTREAGIYVTLHTSSLDQISARVTELNDPTRVFDTNYRQMVERVATQRREEFTSGLSAWGAGSLTDSTLTGVQSSDAAARNRALAGIWGMSTQEQRNDILQGLINKRNSPGGLNASEEQMLTFIQTGGNGAVEANRQRAVRWNADLRAAVTADGNGFKVGPGAYEAANRNIRPASALEFLSRVGAPKGNPETFDLYRRTLGRTAPDGTTQLAFRVGNTERALSLPADRTQAARLLAEFRQRNPGAELITPRTQGPNDAQGNPTWKPNEAYDRVVKAREERERALVSATETAERAARNLEANKDNLVTAETDYYMENYAAQEALKKARAAVDADGTPDGQPPAEGAKPPVANNSEAPAGT